MLTQSESPSFALTLVSQIPRIIVWASETASIIRSLHVDFFEAVMGLEMALVT